MDYISLLGYVAGILLVISLLPQVIKSWKTKSTHDISVHQYLIYIFAVFLMIVYTYLLGSLPLLLTNVCALILALIILYLKLKYG